MTDRRDIVAQASELGADLDRGAGVVVLRAAPRAAQTGEWRERVLVLAQRALRALAPGSLAASDGGEAAAESSRSSPPRTTSGWPGPRPGSRASSTTASRAST